MRQNIRKEFKIKYLAPFGCGHEANWTLERVYWAHVERMLLSGKMVDDENEIARYSDRSKEYQRKWQRESEKITKENVYYSDRIRNTETYYGREACDKEWRWKNLIMKHMCKHPLLWKIKLSDDIVFKSGPHSRMAMVSPAEHIPTPVVNFKIRPRCFFDMRIENDIHLGRIIFELYGEFVPKTAANFLSLCKGYEGLTYKGSFLHRIMPGLMCQGGDITEFNGSGGMTIFGEVFNKENFQLKHGGMGVLSMTSISPTKNSSQFNITFKALHALDGNSVVIGKVVKGINTLLKIEEFGYGTGKPRRKVVITDCGQL